MTTDTAPLRVHLIERPNTRALLSGALSAPGLRLDFRGPPSGPAGFRQMVRAAAFDVSEMPLMTFITARSFGRPLVLLPATVLGRFQHRFLVCRKDSPLSVGDLAGKRIAGRSYSVTTVTLVRSILQRQYGVAPDSMHWMVTEGSHVPEYQAPDFVTRIAEDGRSLEDLVLDGTVDAAVLGTETQHPGLRRMIPDAEAAARDWYARTGTVQINHVVTVDAGVAAGRLPEIRALWDLLGQAKAQGPVQEIGLDVLPYGLEASRASLDLALEDAFAQRLTPRRMAVEDLLDPQTLSFI